MPSLDFFHKHAVCFASSYPWCIEFITWSALLSHHKRNVPGFIWKRTKTPVFKQTRVRMFGPNQSSNELSHHPKRIRLSEEMNQGLFKVDQTALVWKQPYCTGLYLVHLQCELCWLQPPHNLAKDERFQIMNEWMNEWMCCSGTLASCIRQTLYIKTQASIRTINKLKATVLFFQVQVMGEWFSKCSNSVNTLTKYFIHSLLSVLQKHCTTKSLLLD